MDTDSKRDLSDNEKRILSRLLSIDFEGRDALLEQIEHAMAIPCLDGCGSIRILTASNKKAAVLCRIPVEGATHDIDGSVVDILLHVVYGTAWELEIVKYGNKTLQQQINPDNIVVTKGRTDLP